MDIINFFINLPKEFAKLGIWLTTPVEYINLPPLAIIGVSGLVMIISFLALRLIVGG